MGEKREVSTSSSRIYVGTNFCFHIWHNHRQFSECCHLAYSCIAVGDAWTVKVCALRTRAVCRRSYSACELCASERKVPVLQETNLVAVSTSRTRNGDFICSVLWDFFGRSTGWHYSKPVSRATGRSATGICPPPFFLGGIGCTVCIRCAMGVTAR